MTRALPYMLVAGLMAVAGCRAPAARTGTAPPGAYFGPTESMNDVVAQINANNLAIPTLRAGGDFEANVVVDRNGRRQFVNGEITLLYRQASEVRLIGNKDLAGRVFEAASNGERYWLIVKGETDTMWWGALDNLDHVDTTQLPIRPDLLVEVLGIDPISPDFLQQPVPALRFNNDADAYMFTFNVRLPDRWAVQKEVWYDRVSKLPRSVLLFDENGRIVLRAYLSNHRTVESSDGRADTPARPRVATRYQLFFPDNGTTMRFELEDLAFSRNRAPNDRSFIFPTEPGVSRVINLDEQARL